MKKGKQTKLGTFLEWVQLNLKKNIYSKSRKNKEVDNYTYPNGKTKFLHLKTSPIGNKAITLISLIITIVVLIILASVGIYLSLGNNGIFNRAKQAKEATNKQTATEIIKLKITEAQMNKYSEKQEMPTLQELADILYADNEIEYVALEKKVANKEKVVVGDKTSIFTKLNDYPYEFEINSSLQLAKIDGEKIPDNITNGNNNQTNTENGDSNYGEYFYKSYNGFTNTHGEGGINSFYGLRPTIYENPPSDETYMVNKPYCRYEKRLNYSFDLSKEFEISFKSRIMTSAAVEGGGIRLRLQKSNNENGDDDVLDFGLYDHWSDNEIGYSSTYNGQRVLEENDSSGQWNERIGIIGDGTNIKFYKGDQIIKTCGQEDNLSFDKVTIYFYKLPSLTKINKICVENLYFGNIKYYKDII